MGYSERKSSRVRRNTDEDDFEADLRDYKRSRRESSSYNYSSDRCSGSRSSYRSISGRGERKDSRSSDYKYRDDSYNDNSYRSRKDSYDHERSGKGSKHSLVSSSNSLSSVTKSNHPHRTSPDRVSRKNSCEKDSSVVIGFASSDEHKRVSAAEATRDDDDEDIDKLMNAFDGNEEDDEDVEQRAIEEQRRRRKALMEKLLREGKAQTANASGVSSPCDTPGSSTVAETPVVVLQKAELPVEKSEGRMDSGSEFAGAGSVSNSAVASGIVPEIAKVYATAKGDSEGKNLAHVVTEAVILSEKEKIEPESVKQSISASKKFKNMPKIDLFGDDPIDDEGLDKLMEHKSTVYTGPSKSHQQRNDLADNWDDEEGYYLTRIGEVLDGQYQVIRMTGKGVFSTVVIGHHVETSEDFAIKIIRNNDTMLKAGQKEMKLLAQLNDADPKEQMHCVRMKGHFYPQRTFVLGVRETAYESP